MSGLDQQEKELVFQDCLGLSSAEEAARTSQLRADNARADESHEKIRAALAPLQSLTPQACPDALAERTIERLRELTREHLASAPPQVVQIGRARNIGNTIAVAASILLVVGILIPSSRLMRHRYYLRRCAGQVANLFRGLDHYSADHDDLFPAVARAANAPWNRIGQPGPDNYSNTRNPYLLLKYDYVERPEDFVCCGSKIDRAVALTPSEIKAHWDFPSRDRITYSYRVMSNPFVKKASLASLPVMADMNPHFEQPSACTAAGMRLRPVPDLPRLNSVNHARRGQTVLYGGGHVRYSRTRFLGDSSDDIYMTEDSEECHGDEVPDCLTDTLLGP